MKLLEDAFLGLCTEANFTHLPRQLEIIKEYAAPLLRQVERACHKAGYTFHGPEHVKTIGTNLLRLVPAHLMGIDAQPIGSYELLILMGAAYTHDLGMLEPEDRKTHNVISAQKIYNFDSGASRIDGVDDQIAYRIGSLCRAHRDHKEENLRVDTLSSVADGYLSGRLIRMQLLACLFRLADELDSGYERAPEDVELSMPLSPESQTHWVTHQLVDSVTIDSARWEITIHPSQRARLDASLMKLVEARRAKIEEELTKMQQYLEKTPFAYKTLQIDGAARTDEKTNGHSLAALDEFSIKTQDLFRTCGHEIEPPPLSSLKNWTFTAKPLQGLDRRPIIVRCSEAQEDLATLDRFAHIRASMPLASLIYVTNRPTFNFVTAAEGLGIQCRTYDQLVVQMINFLPYIDRVLQDRNLLALEQEYEQPFVDSPGGQRLAWEYIDSWLANPNSNWLTVLGDYGIGKTALLQMTLLKLMRRYKEAPEDRPIPILIPLQNFVKSFTFRNLILALFEDIGLSGVYYHAFENWVRRGRIVLLLDSFDEMAQKLGRAEIQNNLRELMSGITGQSKAILTSRPTYFESGAERLRMFADVNLIPEDHEDYSLYKAYSEFDLQLQNQIKTTTTIQLSDLTEDQRRRFFARVLTKPEAIEKLNRMMNRMQGLAQMTERPVIARLLMMAVPSLRESDIDQMPVDLNEASVFRLIVAQLLQRDENLFGGQLTNSERHLFLKELAFVISKQGNDNYVSNRVIRALVERLFALKIHSHETPEIVAEQYFRACRRAAGLSVEKTAAGLTRDIEDWDSRVGFSHNALREYLYAEFVREHLFGDRAVSLFFNATISDQTVTFLGYMLGDDENQKLLSEIQGHGRLREFAFDIAWRLLPNESREEMAAIVGDALDFALMDLSGLDLSERDLSGATFSNSLIGGVNFRESNLDGANFQGAVIEMTALDDASLEGTSFAKADVRSIVVYDAGQKRVLTRFGDDARQWLFTSGSEIGAKDQINPLTRSRKYQVAYKVLRKMERYKFGSTHHEFGLLRGIRQDQLTIGREFVEMLSSRDYLRFVRKATKGGRGTNVLEIARERRQDLQDLFDGRCPPKLMDFFDDLE